ncbi:GntR family transcriptional regulator [Nocardiopsis ansamitocini]|uniref:GntR family transcriptional regulator n=1 Tax=Nocardiopsis ansamitocini TaxID=1670832 RepID=A0A9W6P3A0_9ACTN|nr:GntR family transcriptional regulator [Nocardiopsis ansamitocini]GLU46296.1 GntR family transcriptional regulator [Nocardiopsis ansamitocini]
MSPQVQRTDPPYMQVVKHIKADIESGVLQDGQKIDSVRAIAAKWKISPATANKVVGTLKAEGLVRSEPGRGSIVTRDQVGASAKDRVIRSLEGRIYATNERAEIRAAELVPAPEEVADALGIPVGTNVIRRQRVTLRDDVPSSASTSWYSGEFAESAPLLLEAERLRQGTPKYVEDQTGLVPAAGKDQLRADIASEEDSAALGIPLGSPVLRKQNWVLSAEGDVIEFGQSVSVPRRWATYNYEISR